jgi:glutathione S-transferase
MRQPSDKNADCSDEAGTGGDAPGALALYLLFRQPQVASCRASGAKEKRKQHAMTQLYYSPGACSLAVHIVLEEIGVPFEAVQVAIKEGAHQTPEYLALNPQGRVPTLVDDGLVLTEAPAILHYLAHRHPQAQLLDREDARALGRTAELLNFFSSSVHIAFAQVWRAERFAHDPKAREEIARVGRETVLQHFDELESLAARADWLVGGRFSIADPYLLVFYRWGGLIGIDMRRYPAWGAHKHRMLQRPAVRRALAREAVNVP